MNTYVKFLRNSLPENFSFASKQIHFENSLCCASSGQPWWNFEWKILSEKLWVKNLELKFLTEDFWLIHLWLLFLTLYFVFQNIYNKGFIWERLEISRGFSILCLLTGALEMPRVLVANHQCRLLWPELVIGTWNDYLNSVPNQLNFMETFNGFNYKISVNGFN